MNPLCYNYHFSSLDEAMFPRIVREFLDYGIHTFVFQYPLFERALKEPEYLLFLKKIASDFKVDFVSMHAPYGSLFDLDIPEADRRPGMIRDHIRAMEIAAEFGSRTYTIHVGAYHHCVKHVPVPELRNLAAESLEQLVPHAERIGVVLAVENSFEPPNSAKEVLRLVSPYADNPAVGVCFDTGHANVMASAPWKDPAKYTEGMRNAWWEHGIVQEDNALELLKPHIVTCHMHDNSGYSDLHCMPFDGTIDWKSLIPALKSCPRMLEFQTEVNLWGGTNWAGTSPAPVGGYSVKRLVETFQSLGF